MKHRCSDQEGPLKLHSLVARALPVALACRKPVFGASVNLDQQFQDQGDTTELTCPSMRCLIKHDRRRLPHLMACPRLGYRNNFKDAHITGSATSDCTIVTGVRMSGRSSGELDRRPPCKDNHRAISSLYDRAYQAWRGAGRCRAAGIDDFSLWRCEEKKQTA